MRPVKSVLGVIGALLPVLYCGGLLYYFMQGNDLSGPTGQGLGPTVLGLGAIGLLFCAPVIFRLIKLLTRTGAPVPPGKGAAIEDAPASDFDPDAALARYMARKAAGGEGAAASPVAWSPEPVVSRPSFGRKIG